MNRKTMHRILAMILTCTLLAGQLMVGQVLATEIPAFAEDSGTLTLVEPTEAPPDPEVTATPSPEPTGTGEPTTTPEPSGDPEPEADPAAAAAVPMLLTEDDQPVSYELPAGEGGISVQVTSSQTQVKDGDQYTFSVTIQDSEPTTEPNIEPGDTLTITLPEFLTTDNMDKALAQCFQYFEEHYTYEGSQLVLTFKQSPDGSWANIAFSITLEVSTVGYGGGSHSSIEVGIGGTETIGGSQGIDVDIGTGGGGEGEERSPYVVKSIWSNKKLSEYGIDGDRYVVRDPKLPIGYAVAFGVNGDYTGSVSLGDDLSGGVLALCDSSGNTGAALSSCFLPLLVGGTEYSPTASGGSLVYSGTPLGTITITPNGSGFTVTCTPAGDGEETGFVDVVLRYFAKAVGDSNDITNSVTLTIDDSYIGSSETSILKYDSQALAITKSILDNAGNPVRSVSLEEEDSVTFRITLTQYGTGSLYKDGDTITFDLLSSCFLYDPDSVVMSSGAPFRLEVDESNSQKIKIIKVGSGTIPTGKHTIDFTVTVTSGLGYGQQATNTVGSTVVIHRKAKLTVNKTWLSKGDGAYPDRGDGAQFALYSGSTLISDSGEMGAGNTFTLYLDAADLLDGEHTYSLVETVDEDSGYAAARAMDVVIRKTATSVEIVSIGGTSYNAGEAAVSVENQPDSGRGSLTFKKYGGSAAEENLLDGGTYELYRAEEDGDRLVKTFSTVGGVFVEELEYGTYYVKEVTAPKGYVLESSATDQVTLKKSAPHQTLSLVNSPYAGGKISIQKEDQDGNALSGVTFTLRSANGSVSQSKTTDASGLAEFTGLSAGVYTITETGPLDGYQCDTRSITVTIDEAGTAVSQTEGTDVTIRGTTSALAVHWTNTRLGSIRIIKTDADTGAVLTGAAFGLYGSDGMLLVQKATGTDGACTFTGLAAGDYSVRELSAPPGYQCSTEVLQFHIGTEDAAGTAWTHEETVENSKRLYGLKVRKTDEDGTQPLSGAEFKLEGSGIQTQTAVSGSDGTAVFTDLPFGTYTITETKAPEGYALAAPVTVTISGSNTPADYEEGQTVEVSVRDTHTKLTVYKVDDKDQQKSLPGTKFKIRSGSGYVTATGAQGAYRYTGESETGTEFVTGADGTFVLEYLPMGSYTLVETEAPGGYVIAEEETAFAVTQATQSVTVGNTLIRAKLALTKADAYGKLLPGVGFTLETAAGYVQASGTSGSYTYTGLGTQPTVLYTDGSGRLTVEGLLWGVYTLAEDAATTPLGLVPAADRTVEITAAEHSQTISLYVANYRDLGELRFTKADEAGDPLPGAVFQLVPVSSGGSSYRETETRYAVSDDDGLVAFPNVPYGVYALSEYLAPYGKALSTAVYYVSIGGAEDTNYQISEPPAVWTNEDQGILVTVKKVSADGTPLSGGLFQVLDGDMEPVGQPFSVDGAGTEIALPAVGVYYLQEVAAPAGYVKEEAPVRFQAVLGANEVVMKNEPFTGSLTIVKEDASDGSPLAGAEFQVYLQTDYGTDRAARYTVTTNSDGTARIEGIPYGDYVVAESKAPEGYELDPTPQEFTIRNAGDTPSASVTLTFQNEKSRYVFAIIKTDILSGEPLSGAAFGVYGDGFYTRAVTGAEGKVTVSVPAPGTYSVIETAVPEGYTLDPNTYTVAVTGHTPLDTEPAVSLAVEDYPTQVRLQKVDELGLPMEGAEFELYPAGKDAPVQFTEENGIYTYAPEGGQTTLSLGSALIQRLPAGSYVLRETVAPENYMRLGDIAFTVDTGRYDQALEITAVNLPYQRGVAVCKENEDGVRLAGAEFSLYSEDGTLIQAVTTGASGYALFPDLRSGSYTLRETAAPEGYQAIDETYAFQIDGDGNLKSKSEFVPYGSEETPFFVLTVSNRAVEQALQVKKVSAASGALLAGAQFRVLGNGIQATYDTGKDGLTEAIRLPVGEYMLTEVQAPQGYAVNPESHQILVTPDGVQVDGEALEGALPVYTVTDEPLSFQFAIRKQDAETSAPLAGAAFTITGEDDTTISLVSDENGMTGRVPLQPGRYAITEAVSPSGYNLPLAGWSFTVEEGSLQVTQVTDAAEYTFAEGLLTLTLTNQRTTGSLLLYKYDADDEALPLSGAQFQLVDDSGDAVWFTRKNGVYHTADAETDGAGNLMTTNALGEALLDGLPFGEYTLLEVTAPEGYRLSAQGIQLKLTRQDETLELRIPNKQLLRKVTVRKQSEEETPQNLMGAVFTLYTEDENGDTHFLAEATTGYDGTAEFTVPYGTYVIAETKAPAGYELSDSEPWHFRYDAQTPEDEAFDYTFTNEPSRYSIEIYKHDQDDPDQGLAGAEFAVTNSQGFTKLIKTGSDGVAVLEPVAYDDYTIREVTAPEGYYLSEQVYTVKKADLQHGQPIRIEAADEYILGSIALKKVDREDPSVVLDAEFTLYDSAGEALCWQETPEGYALVDEGETVIHAGAVLLSGLPAGTYSIREVTAPEGYVALDGDRTFAITAENARAGLEIEIENLHRQTAVGIIKTDKADRTQRLAGAEFTLYPLDGGTVGAAIQTMATDANGLAVFTGLTMGSYRILETKAPEGYRLWSSPVDFSIDKDGNVLVGKEQVPLPEIDQIYMVGILNEAEAQTLTLKKVSGSDGTPLEGAVFTLTGGGKVWRIATGADGTEPLDLPYGEYVLEELIAPDGYVLDGAMHLVEVSAQGIRVDGTDLEENTYTLENTPVSFPLSLHKQDSASGNPLAGAEFRISGGDVKLDLTTNASGNTDTIYLSPGSYSLSEAKAPSGYKKPLGGWTLTVAADGRVELEGDQATVSLGTAGAIVTLENTKKSTPGSTPGSGIAKTGQLGDSALLTGGLVLMLGSFCGLLALLLEERKRRRKLQRLD